MNATTWKFADWTPTEVDEQNMIPNKDDGKLDRELNRELFAQC